MFGMDRMQMDPGRSVMFVTFQGANMDVDEYDGKIDYAPRGEIVINVDQIAAFYDHTIITQGRKIRVMDTLAEIRKKIGLPKMHEA